ncbi:hypothetical protein EUTSA_v10029521mg, partial [Eutrema salsugineum]
MKLTIRFQTETNRSLNLFSPFLTDDAPGVSHSPIKALRKVSRSPYKKKCGRTEEQVELLKQKLQMIYQGEAFNGKPTKTARSHGKKFQVMVEKETSKIL